MGVGGRREAAAGRLLAAMTCRRGCGPCAHLSGGAGRGFEWASRQVSLCSRPGLPSRPNPSHPPTAQARELETIEELEVLLAATGDVALLYSAEWCTVCKRMAPALATLPPHLPDGLHFAVTELEVGCRPPPFVQRLCTKHGVSCCHGVP